jgi:hypothetical protein
MTFLVLGLPRSRTAWLSQFLTYGDHICGHEELRHCRSLDDVKSLLSMPHWGSAETSAAPFWRLASRLSPELRVVVIRRPVDDVVNSLASFGFDSAVMHPAMRKLDAKLTQLAKRFPNVLEIQFNDLNSEETCKAVFKHCLPYSWDRLHWATLAEQNIQCNMMEIVRYVAAFRLQLSKLAAIAKHVELVEMTSRRPIEPSGITFQTEDCDTWKRDAKRLFESHCVVVGENVDEWESKNWELFKALETVGALQITTARSNGRMFGYLMTIIAPSLVSDKVTSATHTTFYADPAFPGLGMKLQREALARLKDRGVDEVVWEAGKRGSGPRLGAMYRRLGAVEHGETYRLQLTEH